MVAPPSPRPPKAQSDGGDAPLSLFLDTDLGTRLAMLVAPDTTIRRLKSQVAAEHAEAFPDIGPVAVKSFQVQRKGALYHLSESMTVTRAFTRVKGGCFLHVKMAEAGVVMRCCQGTSEIDGRGASECHVGIHVERHVRELPAATPEVANDGLTHGLGGGDATAVLNNVHAHGVPNDVPLTPPSQLSAETKKEAGLARDAVINKSLKQTNISHVVEADANKDLLHGNEDRDIDVDVSDTKQINIEENMLGQVHNVDDISEGKERKKAKQTNSVSATDPRIATESDTMDISKSTRAPLETNPTINDNIPEDSLQIEDPITVGKKKKRKRRQLAPFEPVSGQETTKLPAGAVGLSKSGGDAYEVDLTHRDGSKDRSSGLLLSSEPNDESQGGEHVQYVDNAQESTDLTSERGDFDHVQTGDRNPATGDAMNSTAGVPTSGEKIAEESNGPRDGEEKHEETKQYKYNEGSHDGAVATSNMAEEGKYIDALEERPRNVTISKEKKRKNVKKVNSVDMASIDTTGHKEVLGHTENAGKSDKVYTEREILLGHSVGPISDNVQQGDSNMIENPNGDGKRKKKRRHQSDSLNSADSNKYQTKSSKNVTNGSSIQHINSAPGAAKQTMQDSVEGATTSEHKFGESDTTAANMINEVLADLKSRDSLSKELSEDLLTGQIQLDSNPNAPDLPASTGNKVGNSPAFPPRYPEHIKPLALTKSPSRKKPKGKKLKVLSNTIDSSHHSCGVPEEDADTRLNESDTWRFSGKASDLMDVLTGDVVAQDDDRAKSTKQQRKKVKKVPTDTGKTTQSLDERVFAREDMKGVNTAIQADLVQGSSVIDTPMETVAKTRKKGKRVSKTPTPEIQETNHSTHAAKDSQDENAINITVAHDNENTSVYPTESPVVQKDATTLKSTCPNARKARKKPLKTELQSRDSDIEHDAGADLVHCSTEKGFSPKNSADAVETNHSIVAHSDSDKINFMDHFSVGKMNDNDQLVSAENVQNKKDEIMEVEHKKGNTGSSEPNDLLELPAEKTSLPDHFGTSEVVVPSDKGENMNREYDNVKSGNEKRNRKRKPAAEKENLDGDNQGTGIGVQDSLHSVVQKGRMGQDNGNENRNVSMMQQEPEGASCDLPINKDIASIRKESQKSTSQKKPHNVVRSFALSPAASSESTYDTPRTGNRYRVAVRKVPKKGYEQDNAKSKKENRKLDSGAIFNDSISEESDDAMDTKGAAFETSPYNSSASTNSGISSTAYDASDVPDNDGASSQKSLRGMHIGSILRGSSSYKKAKQKQAEMLDDDTEVPDSQPIDGLWG